MKKAAKAFLFLMLILAFSLFLSAFISTIGHHSSIARAQLPTPQPPVATFAYTPEIPQPGETIVFDASASYSPEGSIEQYTWDFGDGNLTAATNPAVTHSYPLDGNYTVELTVTDNNGETATAAAVVQVQKEIYFRISFYGTVIPTANAQVTIYYYNGTAWAKAPARSSNPGVQIIYDNMTQPNKASTPSQKNRNPGFTASILLNNASNIGFDTHPSSMLVFFKIEWGPYVAYWPNNTATYYKYDKYHGTAVLTNFEPCDRPYWDGNAGTYVIEASHIKSDGSSPIVTGVFCPPPPTNYYLTVRTDPTGITTIPGQGSYAQNTNVTLTAPTYVNVSSTSRYRFNYWDVDGTSRGSGVNPITVFMNANHTATAHYIMQYYLTVSSTYDSPSPASGWFDSGSSITESVTTPVSGGSGTQYVCTGWTGTGSVPASGSASSVTFAINAPSSITWAWKTQYYLTVSSARDSPSPVSGWFDSGSSITESVTSPVSGVSGTQYVCTGWTGSGSVPASGTASSVAFTITAPSSITWSWKTQYYLTVSSPHDSPSPVSGWFDSGSSITESVTSPVSGGSGIQYVCTGWTGTGSVPASGSSSSVTFTITGTSSITWSWKTQYYLTVSSAYDSPSPVSGWFDSGSSITESVTTPASGPTGTRYVCTGWTGTGSIPSTGSGSSVSFTITAPSSITWNWKTQYYLTVSSAYDSPSPVSGWFDSGSSITESVTSPVSGGSGIQYVCTGWTGTGSVPTSGTGLSVSFTITAPSSVTWNWKTQYYLTVVSARDSPSPVSGWFDSGSSITESVTSPVSGGSGIQYVCTGWTGTGSVPASGSAISVTFTISSASSITWNWKTQYQVTFGQTGVDLSFTGTVVSIDSVNYGVSGLSVSFWWDSGGSHSFSFASPLVVSSVQYVWSSTSGLSTLQSGTLTAAGPGSVVGNYQVQNRITFDQLGVNPDFTSTVVIIDSVSYSKAQLPVSFSWGVGSVHSFAFQSPLVVGSNTEQYVWTNTTGLSSSQSTSITITTYGSIIGNYKAQYYLTVSSAYDSPSPSSGWFDSGASVTESVTSPVSGGSGTQYVCTGWSGSGSVPASGTASSVTFAITQASSIAWNWKTQYYLTVTSAYDSPTPVSGWFDSGASVTESVTSPVSGGSGTQYVCTGWSGSGSVPASGTNSSVTFAIGAPSAITWTWKTQYYLTVSSAYDSPSPSSGWFDSGSSVTDSVTSPTAGPAGTQYVCTGWSGTGSVPVSGTASSIMFTISAPSSVTWNWKTQYYLTVTSAYDSPTPVSGWFDSGASVTESVTSPVSGGSGTQYVCTGWSGSGSVPASGTASSVTFAITQASSIAWNWKTQYQVTFDQSGVGSDFTGNLVTIDSVNYGVGGLPISFWWDSSSLHTFSFSSPLLVNVSEQYNWVSTSGLTTLQSGSLSVASSGGVTGNYAIETKLQVTFSQTGLIPDFTGTVLTVDATNYNVTDLPVSFWWDPSSVHSFAYQSPLIVSPSAKQYVWNGTTGLSTQQSESITVTTSGGITGNYKTQYYLTLATAPSGVNSPSGTSWYDAGTNATVSTDAFVDIIPGSSRYRFNGWTTADMSEISNPIATPTTVLVDNTKTVTATYALQYYVTFSQTGVGSDFTGTVVIIDGGNYTVASLPTSGGFWWDNGAVHTFAFQSPLVAVANTKSYRWTSTTGLSTSQTGTLTISAPGSVVGNYRIQYYLTDASPYGLPTPASGWFDDGSSVTASVTSPASGPTGTQYVCNGWSGTGSVPSSGSGTTTTFTMTQASAITWNWKTQYYLTVKTDPLGLATILGQGWYDAASSSASLNAPPVTGWTFSNWDVDGTPQGSTNPITVNMDAAHTATAHYTQITGQPLTVSISPMIVTTTVGSGVPFTPSVGGGTAPYAYQWYLNGNPVLGATSANWTFLPTTSGVYYVYLQVTDAAHTTAQSGTARIEVLSGPPVGGFSISMEKPTHLSYLEAYMGLIALLGAVFCLTRRKRK